MAQIFTLLLLLAVPLSGFATLRIVDGKTIVFGSFWKENTITPWTYIFLDDLFSTESLPGVKELTSTEYDAIQSDLRLPNKVITEAKMVKTKKVKFSDNLDYLIDDTAIIFRKGQTDCLLFFFENHEEPGYFWACLFQKRHTIIFKDPHPLFTQNKTTKKKVVAIITTEKQPIYKPASVNKSQLQIIFSDTEKTKGIIIMGNIYTFDFEKIETTSYDLEDNIDLPEQNSEENESLI